jgi:signal transduction histidine kinase
MPSPNIESSFTSGANDATNASHIGLARIMAVAGHDLKQPLQLAVMSIERAMLDTFDTKVASRLSLALDALFRLDGELSELARSSQIALSEEEATNLVDLRDVLDRVESDWADYAETSGIALTVDQCDMVVRSNDSMLRTILRNLVGNAIKYSPRGSSVAVSCRSSAQETTIEITDSGCGISEVDLTKIFDAFQRGDQTNDSSGLGLGLHIVRETAGILKHPVTVRSIEGEGSTFAVTIPRYVA